MPQESRDSKRELSDAVAKQWADWLVRTRTARGKRPIDLVEAAAAIGEKLTTGQISNWEGGRNPASPESARLVAKLLGVDPVDALRAAGHDDWADFTLEQRAGTVAEPPHPSALREDLAALYATDLPDHLKQKFEHEYMEFVEPMVHGSEAARRKFHAEVKEAIRDQGQRGSRGATG